MASSNTSKTYKCPFCEKRFTRANLVDHIEDKHEAELPEGFSAFRYVFHYVNKRPLTYHGICTECKGPTEWDEERGRYKRQCGKKACHDSYVAKFEKNMVRTKGVTRISSTQEGQVKMLAHRKISGTYTFSNGETKGYTGAYEKTTLEFMDKVLHLDPNDIMSPGPILSYKYKGKDHFYITDFYYQPYNLIIEVKDGGKNPNNRSMPEYREKQMEKEKFIIEHTNYNYIRLTDNDLKQLVSVFLDLKYQMIENTGERVIHINEEYLTEFMGMAKYMPVIGFKQNNQCVYIRNYLQNNVFSGEDINAYELAVSPSFKFDTVYRLKEGALIVQTLDEALADGLKFDNKLYCKKDFDWKCLKNEGTMYERIFGKKEYSKDQIMTENLQVLPSFETYCDILKSMTTNFLLKESVVPTNESYETGSNLVLGSDVVYSNNHKLASETFGLDPSIVKGILNIVEEAYYGQ
ncbi:MAG: hypothetical protein IKR19_08210 [Acholeplasmatales bacterium]|nr:hypothetical protein [Acholeplasmatales bacterium]